MANSIMKHLKVGNTTYDFDATKFGGQDPSYYAKQEDLNGVIADLVSNLQYKGALEAGTDASSTTYTPVAYVGDVYIAGNSGYINGVHVDRGDLWLCNTDTVGASSSNVATVNACWDLVQGNLSWAELEDAFSESGHTHEVSVQVDVTPEGTISTPEFTGYEDQHTHTINLTHNHTFTGTTAEISVTGNTSGSISTETFTPEGTISEIEYVPEGTIGITASSATGADATFTPTVTVGQAGAHSHSLSTSYKPEGTVTGGSHEHTASVTLSGSLTGDTLTLSASADVDNASPANLVFTGTEATISGNTSEDGAHDHAATAGGIKLTPTFTGTQKTLSHTFTGKLITNTHTFTGATITSTGNYTPAGTVGNYTNDSATTSEYTYTPAGAISTPTFTGTEVIYNGSGETQAASK